jgi:hypothetical protein
MKVLRVRLRTIPLQVQHVRNALDVTLLERLIAIDELIVQYLNFVRIRENFFKKSLQQISRVFSQKWVPVLRKGKV